MRAQSLALSSPSLPPSPRHSAWQSVCTVLWGTHPARPAARSPATHTCAYVCVSGVHLHMHTHNSACPTGAESQPWTGALHMPDRMCYVKFPAGPPVCLLQRAGATSAAGGICVQTPGLELLVPGLPPHGAHCSPSYLPHMAHTHPAAQGPSHVRGTFSATAFETQDPLELWYGLLSWQG